MGKCYKKVCKNCGSKNTKKDGKRKWRQSYKCNNCKYIWISKGRKKEKVSIDQMYKEYAIHKQTYDELADKHKISKRTVQKYLDSYKGKLSETKPKEIVLLIDTTYFWSFGLMVFKEVDNGKILHYEIVHYETNEHYKLWILKLKQQWRIIKAIVCDGRRWLLGWFGNIPTQMCHFHQHQTIRKYITKKPLLEANKELKEIIRWLRRTEKSCFEYELNYWYKKHKDFLNEKWVTENWKTYYIHRRTRSAYYSLKNHMKYLFVYLDYLWSMNIPNTTNGLEWMFGHLKYKVFLHRWLREDRKKKLIIYLLNSRK